MTSTFINDYDTGQVDVYLQGLISTSVYETARLICGGGNGLRIRTATAHPILLQTQNATVLTLGVDKSATFTGQVNGTTKAMINLSNVDDTSDLNKTISTAVANALALKLDSTTIPCSFASLTATAGGAWPIW